MPSSSDNGATATAMAAVAEAAAQQAADEAHRARCAVIFEHDPRGSVQNMQSFASCVEFVHPVSGPTTLADKVLFSSLGTVVLVCIIVGAIKMCRSEGVEMLSILFGAFAGCIVGAVIAGVIFCFAALGQYLLS